MNKITEIDKRVERVETALAMLRQEHSLERGAEYHKAWAEATFNYFEDMHFLLDRVEQLEKEIQWRSNQNN